MDTFTTPPTPNKIAIKPTAPVARADLATHLPIEQGVRHSPVARTQHTDTYVQDNQARQETLKQAANELNNKLEPYSTALKFEVDEDIGRIVISILDAQSGDVLRTIPTDAVLHAAKVLTDLKMKGVAVDTQA